MVKPKLLDSLVVLLPPLWTHLAFAEFHVRQVGAADFQHLRHVRSGDAFLFPLVSENVVSGAGVFHRGECLADKWKRRKNYFAEFRFAISAGNHTPHMPSHSLPNKSGCCSLPAKSTSRSGLHDA